MTTPLSVSDPPPSDEAFEATTTPLDQTMKAAIIGVAMVGGLTAVIAGVGWGAAAGLGVLVGAAVATFNLWGFALIVKGILGGGRGSWLWTLAGIVKLSLLFGAAYYVMDRGSHGNSCSSTKRSFYSISVLSSNIPCFPCIGNNAISFYFSDDIIVPIHDIDGTILI